MPPKQKINRQMILDCAMDMFNKGGMNAINARSVARALNCSTQPIFSYYAGMTDLRETVSVAANDMFEQNVLNAGSESDSLEDFCRRYVDFATKNAKIFNYIFVEGNGREGMQIPFDKLLHLEEVQFSFDEGKAFDVCHKLFLFAHGLASTQAAHKTYNDEEIAGMLNDMHNRLRA